MSRTRRAITLALFQYAQLTLALASGVIVFPLTIRAIGVYNFGLWLASGEFVGYLLLGDLGVFAALPWLVATRDGARDRPGIARLMTDGLVVGCVMASILLGASFWALNSASFQSHSGEWEPVRSAVIVLLGLSAVGFFVRPFPALLHGLQDFVFCGWMGLAQAALTVGLTIGLVVIGEFGFVGLAIAAALPPVLVGVASAGRVAISHRYALKLARPSGAGVWLLVREGFGPWLAGFGTRLLTGSTSIVLICLGRPAEATLYAATMKLTQLLQTAAWILPDSALVGLSQMWVTETSSNIRRTVLSWLLMYLLLSGFMGFAILAVNPVIVRLWLGPDLYAGNAVNVLIAANLICGALVASLFKVVATRGYRPAVGLASLVFGAIAAGFSYGLGTIGGLSWVAAGPVVAAVVFGIPVGLWLLSQVHSLSPLEVIGWWAAWAARSAPFLIIGGATGATLIDQPLWCFIAAFVLGLVYLSSTRSLIAAVPWPAAARRILVRLRVVPVEPTERLA